MSTINSTDAAEIADAAFKELLHDPMPQTALEFSRAIVQAVLIGRTLEAATSGPWQTTKPERAGVWEVASAETDFEPSRVRLFDRDGKLWVECPATGTNPLTPYHGNLIDVRWRPTTKL